MRLPRFVGRLFVGDAGLAMMTDPRGASNAKAKGELEWMAARPSWRQGFWPDDRHDVTRRADHGYTIRG